MKKLQGWHIGQDSSAPQYKNIVPGDTVNHKASLNQAYAKMGEAMAKDDYDFQKQQERSERLLNDAKTFGISPKIATKHNGEPISTSFGVQLNIGDLMTPQISKKPSAIRTVARIITIIVCIAMVLALIFGYAEIRLGI